MNFEEFENKIREKGYGIVAMNHYKLSGKWNTYCVVLNKDNDKALKAEGENSKDVFQNIYNQI